MRIFDSDLVKCVRSENYNYNFSKETGYFERWGKTKDDDPFMAPFNEIADIEISEVCHQGCSFCVIPDTNITMAKQKIQIRHIKKMKKLFLFN